MNAKPSTFVIVHGAWSGGWCYARVAHLLRARGHTVFTPTLTVEARRSASRSARNGYRTTITVVPTLTRS
jgi:hypothetical protein